MASNKLNEFLELNKKKDNEKHTHSQPGKGSYRIDSKDLTTFYELIKEHIFDNGKKITIFEKLSLIRNS